MFVSRCPSENELARFASGVLSPTERDPLLQHVRGCPGCFALAARVLDASVVDGAATAPQRPQRHVAITTTAPASLASPSGQEFGLRRGTTLERYVILDRLGAGGMGVVYAAYDTELDRKLAIKVLPGKAAPGSEAQARLRREAQALARLQHPNVVAVFDVATVDDQLFVAMEYVDGTTLRKWMQERTRSVREIVDVFVSAGQALAAAHSAGIVHRDFKPDNVMVAKDGRVRVLDFGLARAVAGSEPTQPASPGLDSAAAWLTGSLTNSGTLLGTPLYMSPEQWRNAPADAHSDQFSFCIALYEALWGEPPFNGDSVASLSAATLRGVVRATGNDAVPSWLEEIVRRGLEVDPAARFASMDELIDALSSDPDDARRQRRRARWLLAAMAALSIVVTFAVGRQLSIVRAERRRTSAMSQLALARAESDPTRAAAYLREIPPPLTGGAVAQAAEDILAEPKSDAVFIGHTGTILSMAFSPDGTKIVSGSADHTARVWNSDGSGEPLLLRGHTGAVNSVTFTSDGERVLTATGEASGDRTARSWNVDGSGGSVLVSDDSADYEMIFSPDATLVAMRSFGTSPLLHVWRLDGSSGPTVIPCRFCTYPAFSPDSTRLIVSSGDYALVWNVDGSGKPIALKQSGQIWALAFSPDGKKIVAGSSDSTATVWNADGSGDAIVLRGHSAGIVAVAFSPNGDRIATGSKDSTALVWNADGSGDAVVLRGHSGTVSSVAFSPDGTRLLTTSSDSFDYRDNTSYRVASSDNTARVWRLDGSNDQLILRGHSAAVSWAGFSPDGTKVLTGSRDHTARIWSVGRRAEPLVLRGHSDLIRSLAFSPDGKRVVTASWDHSARVWDTATGAQVSALLGHSNGIRSVSFSPDGTKIITGSFDKTARVWRVDDPRNPVVLSGHTDMVEAVAFSPDGQRVVTASADDTARVWNADGSGQPIVLRGHSAVIDCVTFSPDGRKILTGSSDKTARLWNADGSGEPVVLRGHTLGVERVAFSPDGSRVLTSSMDKTARLWNVDGTNPVVLAGHTGYVFAVAFSRDGRKIVTGSQDETVRVWNGDGSGPTVVLRGHLGAIRSIAFSPDGQRIVTAAEDGSVRIWNTDGSGEALVLRGHLDAVEIATFSPGGTQILSGSKDATARLWTADPVQALWTQFRYCPSVDERMRLFGQSPAIAKLGTAQCQQTVRHCQLDFDTCKRAIAIMYDAFR